MLQWLADFRRRFPPSNVFPLHHLPHRQRRREIATLLFVFLFGPAIISTLRLETGQGATIRTDRRSPTSPHQKGTPTMGD